VNILRALPILIVTVAVNGQADDGINVAVASNFLEVATEIAEKYTLSSGVPVRVIPGSTGHLYAQVVAGAPYDVFLAADVARPTALIQRKLADADTLTVYAVGYLVLWSNDAAYERHNCYQDFLDGNFRYLAIANPDTAPYGEAASRFLQAIGRWDDFADKLAYGENVLQAFQFAASGSANLGLVAASHAMAYSSDNHADRKVTCLSSLPEALSGLSRVEQGGVVMSRSANQHRARDFLQYMRGADIVALLTRRGYSTPSARADTE
tara:strand:+ start:7863 stop:8660 length:798 start_codon:yes stop_codon:yes gene_type:complete